MNRWIWLPSLCLLLCMGLRGLGQSEYQWTIQAKSTIQQGQVLSTIIPPLPNVTADTLQQWQVFLVGKEREIPMKTQLSIEDHLTVYWRVGEKIDAGQKVKFRLKKASVVAPKDSLVVWKDDGKSLQCETNSGQIIFAYRYEDMPVPEGVSQVFSRSGFVHPLKTLNGNVVSRIQPDDHYHHYGLWNPWVHTLYKGEEIDFWNLIKEQGTVKHGAVLGYSNGPIFQELKVLLHHVIHPGHGEQTVMNEIQTYRIYVVDGESPYWYLDVRSAYHMVGQAPLTIKEYRYQGFSLRGPKHWEDDNVNVLTSAGKDKSNGNATRAQWIRVNGPGSIEGDIALVMMTYPTNFNYPELLRIWPTGTNKGKGNVFINFNPTQDRDWILNPGHTYVMKYRVLLADRELSPSEAEQYHKDYLQSSYSLHWDVD